MILNASVYHRLIVHLGLTFCLRMMHRRSLVMDRRQLECWHSVPRVTRNSLPRLKTWHRLTLNIPRTFFDSSRETFGCLWKTMALFTRHISETFNPGLKVDYKKLSATKRSSWSSKVAFSKSCKSTDLLLILTTKKFSVIRVTSPLQKSFPWPMRGSSEPSQPIRSQ